MPCPDNLAETPSPNPSEPKNIAVRCRDRSVSSGLHVYIVVSGLVQPVAETPFFSLMLLWLHQFVTNT